MSSKPPKIFHPILFTLFPPLFLFSENVFKLFYIELLVPTLMISVLSICMWITIKVFVKSRKRSGLILSCLILSIFSYSNLSTFSISLFRLNVNPFSTVLVAAWFILVVIAIWIVSRLKTSLANWTRVLNIFAICLISLPLIKIISSFPEKISAYKNRNTYIKYDEFPKPDTIPDTLPNIYYLVLDEQIGFPTMDRFGYDSSVLKEALREKGFFLAEKSKSNYPWTILAMPSTLNFKYLDMPSEKGTSIEKDHRPLHSLMDHNRVFQFLKSYGYTNIHCSTTEIASLQIETADKVLIHYPWYYSTIAIELLANTSFYPMLTYFMANEGENRLRLKLRLKDLFRRRHIEKSFEEIKNITSRKGPFMIYAHIMIPHKPYIYDENGHYPKKGKKFSGVQVESYHPELQDKLRKYFAQMTYLHKVILNIIDHIKENSEEPPIIIVQGDHGIRHMVLQREKEGRTDIPQDIFPELFSVLNVYHFPGFDYSQLDDDISPVNTFRVIFNHYFKTDFAILPNRHFFSFPDNQRDFQEVTNLVDSHKDQ